MLKTLTAAALLGSAAIAGLASAQTAPRPAADAHVTRAEFIARAEASFARMDLNKDGVLTREERRAGRPARGDRALGPMGSRLAVTQETAPPPPPPGDRMAGRPGGMRGPGGGLARMDGNGDGKVTRAEYDAGARTRFDRMDTNADGTIDATEMAALPGGGRGMRADTNGDGKLTRAESDAMSKERFDRLDGNGDGVLDAAELQAGPGMRGGRGGGRQRGAMPAPAATPTPTPTPTGA